MHKSPKYISENSFPVPLLVHTNLFILRRFWTTCANFIKLDNCCQSYIASCGKIFLYRPKTTAVKFYSNLSAIYMKWCTQTFLSIFWLFAIFDRNFAKIVPPPSDANVNYVVHVKEQFILKNAENLLEIGL